ncbi:hypothetical protein PFISCL1PPCAC_17890, partial [Pristionchus fissidentatus]
SFSESRVEFDHSALYDMYDFRGNPKTELGGCETGCRVYLSYPDDDPVVERTIGQMTIELDDGTNITSFTELHSAQLDNGQKGFFAIPLTESFTVVNHNNNDAVRPLALLVVKNDAR